MRNIALLFAVAVILLATSDNATAGDKVDYLKTGAVTLETTPCWDHMFESVSVKGNDGVTTVHGDIGKHHSQSARSDKLRITIISPSGEIVAERTVTWRPKGKAIKQHRGKARFNTTFEMAVTEGSIVKVDCLAQHEHK